MEKPMSHKKEMQRAETSIGLDLENAMITSWVWPRVLLLAQTREFGTLYGRPSSARTSLLQQSTG